MNKKLLITAISHKRGNYCVAAYDLDDRKHIRPFYYQKAGESHRDEGALSKAEITCSNGKELKFGDVVSWNMNIKDFPISTTQPENMYFYIGRPEYIESLGIDEVIEELSEVKNKHNNIFDSTHRCVQAPCGRSIEWIYAEIINIRIEDEFKFKVDFKYNSVTYQNVSLTDIDWTTTNNANLAEFKGNAYMLVTLTDIFKNAHWIIVATMIIINEE